MKAFLSVLAAFAVMGLAFWAYRENYATQAALDEVEQLEREIAGARDALSVLRAEWAYLNRPDRHDLLACRQCLFRRRAGLCVLLFPESASGGWYQSRRACYRLCTSGLATPLR